MAMRTVAALRMEERMAEKYRDNLKEAERVALRASVWVSLGELSRSLGDYAACSKFGVDQR